jgi:hypothetical protein
MIRFRIALAVVGFLAFVAMLVAEASQWLAM